MEDAANLGNSWDYAKRHPSSKVITFILIKAPSFGELDLRFLFPFSTVYHCDLRWPTGSSRPVKHSSTVFDFCAH